MRMPTTRTLAAAALLLVTATSNPAAQAAQELDATPYLDPTRGDAGIQLAIDALSEKGGGTVVLPAGTFVLERYLYLHSNITLRGQGEATVLTLGEPESTHALTGNVAPQDTEIPVDGDLSELKPGYIVDIWRGGPGTHDNNIRPYRVVEVRGQTVVIDKPNPFPLRVSNGPPHLAWGRTTTLAAPAVKGERTIRVEHPELLRPNQGIAFNGKGDLWNHHFNAVESVDGDVLTLARPLTVNAEAGVHVRLAHSAITADGETNIGVENLVIQGFTVPRKPRSGGFELGGIHFVRSENMTIRNVDIHDWNGDAFSVQAGRYANVENCRAFNSIGHGFHPGTGLNDAEFTHLHSESNGRDGLYYCWHLKRVNVRNSTFIDNGEHGIGALGIPGDQHNIVEHNTIERNGQAGIELIGGNDANNIVRGNIIRDNSQAKPGAWPGILVTAQQTNAIRQVTIEGNTIESTLAEPTQWVGIEERHAKAHASKAESPTVVNGLLLADQNRIVNNTLTGHRNADVIVRGPSTVVEGEQGKVVEDRLQAE